jgi:hypothetical protein
VMTSFAEQIHKYGIPRNKCNFSNKGMSNTITVYVYLCPDNYNYIKSFTFLDITPCSPLNFFFRLQFLKYKIVFSQNMEFSFPLQCLCHNTTRAQMQCDVPCEYLELIPDVTRAIHLCLWSKIIYQIVAVCRIKFQQEI